MASNKPPRPTSSSPAKAGAKPEKPAEKVVAENRKARHDYEILDTLECGIALVGSEVKSLRSGRTSLDEAYGRMQGTEVWLLGCDIPEYEKANQLNHKPKRQRKLLLHRRETGLTLCLCRLRHLQLSRQSRRPCGQRGHPLSQPPATHRAPAPTRGRLSIQWL